MTIFFRFLLSPSKSLFLIFFFLFSSCFTSSGYKEFYNQAIVDFSRGNLCEAIINYEKSLFLKPNFYKARFNLILILIELGEWDRVEENLGYLNKRIESENIFLLKIEAYYLFKSGKEEESFILYTRLEELLPLDLEILYNLAYLNVVNQNNLRESYRLLKKINQVDPSFKGLKASWVQSLGFSF